MAATSLKKPPSASPSSEPEKKRKRTDPALTELEVDVNAPEPPSKKAKRLLKKGKPLPVKPKSPSPSPSPSSASASTPGEQEEDAGTNLATDATEAKPHSSTKSPNPKTKTKPKPKSKAKTKEKTDPPRSEHSIWIGNLPFSATPESLRTFLQSNAGLQSSEITRIHLPPPTGATLASTHSRLKPSNRGFAYVDFSSAEAQAAAQALSETLLGGRRVLIKDAGSFEGRPEKKKEEKGDKGDGGAEGLQGADGKSPGKRVFVGNLHFDTQREDLREHFEQCGVVEDCFLATFEDTGKCKGYAWVTFADEEGAVQAVRGFVYKKQGGDGEGEKGEEEDYDETVEGGDADKAKGSSKKSSTPRKWFVNRFHGRALRLEFGENATHRYKKRFGKAPPPAEGVGAGAGDGEEADLNAVSEKPKAAEAANGSLKPKKVVTKDRKREAPERRKVDARTINPGAANASAQRASAAIVQSKGTKVTFD